MPAAAAGQRAILAQRPPPSEHDRAPAVDDHPVVEVERYRPRQHQTLDVAPDPLEVANALLVIDANHVLLDDRPVVQLLAGVVRGRADQLDTVLARLAVRPGAGERRKEG